MRLHDSFEWDEDKAEKNLKSIESRSTTPQACSRMRKETSIMLKNLIGSTVTARIATSRPAPTRKTAGSSSESPGRIGSGAMSG
jgi:hypothetical protein